MVRLEANRAFVSDVSRETVAKRSSSQLITREPTSVYGNPGQCPACRTTVLKGSCGVAMVLRTSLFHVKQCAIRGQLAGFVVVTRSRLSPLGPA